MVYGVDLPTEIAYTYRISDNNNPGPPILDEIFYEEGFELFWDSKRPINWHRNHGYARLKEERISVHIKTN